MIFSLDAYVYIAASVTIFFTLYISKFTMLYKGERGCMMTLDASFVHHICAANFTKDHYMNHFVKTEHVVSS